MAPQPAISWSDRPHPAHSPVLASITHTFVHGVCIGLSKSVDGDSVSPRPPECRKWSAQWQCGSPNCCGFPATAGIGGHGPRLLALRWGRRWPAVALLPKRLQRWHGAQDPASRQANNGFRAFAQLGTQLECTAVQADQVLHDRQAEPRAALGRLVGKRALPERLHDAGDLLLGDAGPESLTLSV